MRRCETRRSRSNRGSRDRGGEEGIKKGCGRLSPKPHTPPSVSSPTPCTLCFKEENRQSRIQPHSAVDAACGCKEGKHRDHGATENREMGAGRKRSRRTVAELYKTSIPPSSVSSPTPCPLCFKKGTADHASNPTRQWMPRAGARKGNTEITEQQRIERWGPGGKGQEGQWPSSTKPQSLPPPCPLPLRALCVSKKEPPITHPTPTLTDRCRSVWRAPGWLAGSRGTDTRDGVCGPT